MDERLIDIEQFAKHLKRRAPDRRTSIDYVSDVRQFAAFCAKPWREITLHDIDAFVDQQRQSGLSQATVKRRVAALRGFFEFLAEEQGDLAWENPVRFKRHAGKPAKRLPRDLTNEQLVQLWSVISLPRDRAWFVLMLRAGLRVGETVSLTLDDVLTPPVLGQPARLRVMGKGRKERRVLLTEDAYAVLQEWLRERPDAVTRHVFLNERGEQLTANGIEWLLRGYSQEAGVKATPHQLRHSFARQLVEGGMPVTSLSKLLGHAQLSTTEIYIAGADPELGRAYQQAMAHLEQNRLPEPGILTGFLPPEPPQPVAVVSVSPPEPPDWDAWGQHWPADIRQSTLAFVQRRALTWKPQRQRQHAQRMLGHLSRYWEWQLTHRPISQPGEVSLADLRAFQTDKIAAGWASSTVNKHTQEVIGLLRELGEQNQPIDNSVFRLRPLARPESLPRHLSETDSQRLDNFVRARLDSPDPTLRVENACYFILAHSGLRASECIDLLGQDLDLEGGRLVVRQGKGQRDRVVYLLETTRQALAAYLGGTRPVPHLPLLRRANGQPIDYSWLHDRMQRLGQAAGDIKFTPHQLRHTVATRLLNAGMEITRIQKLLGHDNLNSTMIYARVLDPTVEADYRRVMSQIGTSPNSSIQLPELVSNWPVPEATDAPVKVEPAPAVAIKVV